MSLLRIPYDALFSVSNLQHDIGSSSNRINRIYAGTGSFSGTFSIAGTASFSSFLNIGGPKQIRFNGAQAIEGSGSALVLASHHSLTQVQARGHFNVLNGTTPTSINVYNSYTNTTNYERCSLGWVDTANAFVINTEKEGTGATRNIHLDVGGSNKMRVTSANVKFYDDIRLNGVGAHNVFERVGYPGTIWSGSYSFIDRSSDPALTTAPGHSIIWQSDGTGSGNDGDMMITITNAAGVTKTKTLLAF